MSQARRDTARDPSAVDRAMARLRSPNERVQAASGGVSSARPQGKVVGCNTERLRFIELLAAARELAATERLVGIRLALFMNARTGQLNPSYETIAAATGTGTRSAKRHIQTLVDAGWIVRKSRRGRVSNEYDLIIPTVPTHGTVG